MSAWSIDPQAVSGIVLTAQVEGETELGPAMEGAGTALESVFGATQSHAPLVAAAVSEWVSAHQSEFESVSTTVENVLTNTVHAVNAYLNHDEQAALEFQRQAR